MVRNTIRLTRILRVVWNTQLGVRAWQKAIRAHTKAATDNIRRGPNLSRNMPAGVMNTV